MPLESAFRGIVSTPATALVTQLLPVSLCNRLSWSVMAADVRLAVVLLVGLMLLLGLMLLTGLMLLLLMVELMLLLLMVGLTLLVGLLAGEWLEAGGRGLAGLSTCGWLIPTQVDGWKRAARVDLD